MQFTLENKAALIAILTIVYAFSYLIATSAKEFICREPFYIWLLFFLNLLFPIIYLWAFTQDNRKLSNLALLTIGIISFLYAWIDFLISYNLLSKHKESSDINSWKWFIGINSVYTIFIWACIFYFLSVIWKRNNSPIII